MSRLSEAARAHHAALTRLAAVYADEITTNGADARGVVEALELLRSQLHHELDDAVDAEQLRRPSGGLAWRARRYCELQIPAA